MTQLARKGECVANFLIKDVYERYLRCANLAN